MAMALSLRMSGATHLRPLYALRACTGTNLPSLLPVSMVSLYILIVARGLRHACYLDTER